MPGDALMTVARDQKRWSQTADQLKNSIQAGREQAFALAIVGAVLETAGAQMHNIYAGIAVWLGYTGAAALAVGGVIRQWKLGHEQTQAWVLARSASEALKREMYLFRTSSGPYASGNPDLTLLDRRDEVLTKAQPAQKFAAEIRGDLAVLGPLDATGYLNTRIEGEKGQINYFNSHADQYAKTQKQFNAAQFGLAIFAALLGAGLTAWGKQSSGAWIAVITTISGAIAAHVLSERYDQLTVTYRATADRLTGAVARWKASANDTLSALVETCEAVLLQENQGWIAGADQNAVPAKQAAETSSTAKAISP